MHLLAYLDAGSGSMIVQIVVGGFAAAAVSLKLFWNRVLTFLHIKKKEDQPAEATATKTEATESEQRAVAESR